MKKIQLLRFRKIIKMKLSTGSTCSIPILLLGICSFHLALGQDEKSITLRVGDNAPPINAYKWIKGEKITNYKKGEIYVIEFGATWCTPCHAMIPELSAISRKFKGSVKVASIFVMEDANESYEKNPSYISKVEKFVKKNNHAMDYIIGIDGPDKAVEKEWLIASQSSGVPHTFVIDKNGKIAWIGIGAEELNRVLDKVSAGDYSINNMIAESLEKSLQVIPYDHSSLLLVNGNGGNENDFQFRSILVKSKGWIEGPQQRHIDGYQWVDKWITVAKSREEYKRMAGRIQTVNMSLMDLYYLAFGDTLSNDPAHRNPYKNWEFPDTINFPSFNISYGKYWFAPILEVKDTTPFYPQSYGAAKRFHYSLKVQTGQPISAGYLQKVMQRDLQNYFGFDVILENRFMPYWKIVVLDPGKVKYGLTAKTQGKKLKWDSGIDSSHFSNVSMRDLIWILGSKFGYGTYDYGRMPLQDQGPFVDETGIKDEIDFHFVKKWSFEEFKKYLNKLGLDVVKSTRVMKVVVIRDGK